MIILIDIILRRNIMNKDTQFEICTLHSEIEELKKELNIKEKNCDLLDAKLKEIEEELNTEILSLSEKTNEQSEMIQKLKKEKEGYCNDLEKDILILEDLYEKTQENLQEINEQINEIKKIRKKRNEKYWETHKFSKFFHIDHNKKMGLMEFFDISTVLILLIALSVFIRVADISFSDKKNIIAIVTFYIALIIPSIYLIISLLIGKYKHTNFVLVFNMFTIIITVVAYVYTTITFNSTITNQESFDSSTIINEYQELQNQLDKMNTTLNQILEKEDKSNHDNTSINININGYDSSHIEANDTIGDLGSIIIDNIRI